MFIRYQFETIHPFLEGIQVTAKDSKNVFRKASELKLNCEKEITQVLGFRSQILLIGYLGISVDI